MKTGQDSKGIVQGGDVRCRSQGTEQRGQCKEDGAKGWGDVERGGAGRFLSTPVVTKLAFLGGLKVVTGNVMRASKAPTLFALSSPSADEDVSLLNLIFPSLSKLFYSYYPSYQTYSFYHSPYSTLIFLKDLLCLNCLFWFFPTYILFT